MIAGLAGLSGCHGGQLNPADVAITENEIRVRFHRPIVLASGLIDKPIAVPWWSGRRLRLVQ